MSVSAPHFLLFAQATDNSSVFSGVTSASLAAGSNERECGGPASGGRWRFVIQNDDGSTLLDVEDEEDGDSRERLELLAIVRGLEALDQPSQVTLVTYSRAISRGLAEGLAQWRENDWQWERFGSLTPIKNRDLWKRVDQAIHIHQVKCRLISGGASDDLNLSPPSDFAQEPKPTTRQHRGRKLRFDPGEPAESTVAAAGSAVVRAPRRRRGLLPPATSPPLWERAVSGVRQLFSR
jgi:ribonuclease HI